MPVQQARARTRQARILRAAASVFAREGYRDAAMDQIARASGTSKGGVYFHFPGKEAVLLALLDQAAGLLRRKVVRAMERETEPVARAEAALAVLLDTLGRHRALARVFAVEALGAGGRFYARVQEIQEEFEALVASELDAAVATGAIPPVDTRVAAQAWVGVLHAVIMRWVLDAASRRALDETYDTVRTMLFRSVGAEPQFAQGRTS